MFYIVYELQRIAHIFATRCQIEMGFESKCSILNGQVVHVEKSKMKIADMWLIPLDRVTYKYGTQSIWEWISGVIKDKTCVILPYSLQ